MKKLKTLLMVSTIVASLSVTAFAVSGVVKNVTAQIRGDIVVRVEGQTQSFKNAQGETIEALSYNGSTYLPVRAIGELMDKEVTWNASTKVIDLDSDKNTVVPDNITDADSIIGGNISIGNTNFDKEIKAIKSEIESAYKKINAITQNTSDSTAREYESELEKIDNKLDNLDDKIEIGYKKGDITKAQYNVLEKSVDSLENLVDQYDNLIETKIGFDYDDDDNDDDHDDDGDND